MRVLFVLLLSAMQLTDSISVLQNKIHEMENLGMMDEAISYNQQLLDMLATTDDEYAEDYVWSIVDMSYFYSSTGALTAATKYALQGIHESQQYISRNMPTWVAQADTDAISDAMQLCESSIRQCYGAIEDSYAGASTAMQEEFKSQFAIDSIIYQIESMCLLTRRMADTNKTGIKSRMLQRLNHSFHRVLWESWLFAHHLSPVADCEVGYMHKLYGSIDDVDYRLRAAVRLVVTSVIKEQADSAQYWLDIIEELDTVKTYMNVIRENRAWMAAQNGEWEKALPLLRESMENKRDALCNELLGMTARARQNTWVNNYAWYFQQNVELCSLSSHPDAVNTFIYDNVLIQKGLLLAVQTELVQLLQEQNLTDISDSLYLVRQMRHRLQQSELNENKTTCASQVNKMRRIEQHILKVANEVGDFTRPLRVTSTDVQAHMDDKMVAVEFIRVTDDDDTAWLKALVLRKGWDAPRLVTIEKESFFAPLTKQRYLYNTSYELTSVVWGKIIMEADIQEGETICFSPDGILYTLGIEYLPLTDEESMSDRYMMCRMSSTREISRNCGDTTISDIVLYGGIQYTTDTTTDGLTSPIRYLPSSLHEVEQINQCLGFGELITGNRGTEASFRAMSGCAPSVIHVATHGFFLSEKSANRLQKQNVQFVRLTDGQKVNVEDIALTRSGLLFAGAGQVWNGELAGGSNDGILTAREIALLDLRRTQMVVLSACKTGLGYATIDGIAGLQRGFKQAGVQTLVMSLWPVDDDATQLLMTQFYYFWCNQHMSRRNAFRQAIQVVRRKYEEADYWAGFVMLD